MRLAPDRVELFYKLHSALLYYANERLGVVPGLQPDEQCPQRISPELALEIRAALHEHKELIDAFVAGNPHGFPDHELRIVRDWKSAVTGTFYIMRHLKKHTVFFGGKPPKAYGVLSLRDELEEMLPPYVLPHMAECVLLPFDDKIVYDGLLSGYNVVFGSGTRRNLEDEQREAVAQFGLITSLQPQTEPVQQSDAARLKILLGSQRSREHNEVEISAIAKKSDELRCLYHQEMGKIHARTYKKALLERDIVAGWFGVLDGLLVGAAGNRSELERTLRPLVPVEQWPLVYMFEIKPAK
ncbi:MAG: hypothetical protein HYV63_09455 [Candidatus Schekmanbacteria bacterium]|nr:hypothetical protein [Candidatus Schekmanbacteria bacterium]